MARDKSLRERLESSRFFQNSCWMADNPLSTGQGKQTRDFVYVDDVVEAIMATIGEDVQGIFNVGTGQESTVNECYGIIKTLTNSSCKDLYGAAKKGEQFRSVLDVTKLRESFGWDPQVSLSEGLKMTVEFFKAQGKMNKTRP